MGLPIAHPFANVSRHPIVQNGKRDNFFSQDVHSLLYYDMVHQDSGSVAARGRDGLFTIQECKDKDDTLEGFRKDGLLFVVPSGFSTCFLQANVNFLYVGFSIVNVARYAFVAS